MCLRFSKGGNGGRVISGYVGPTFRPKGYVQRDYAAPGRLYRLVVCLALVSVVILVFCWRNLSTNQPVPDLYLGCRLISVLLIWLMFLEVSFRLESAADT